MPNHPCPSSLEPPHPRTFPQQLLEFKVVCRQHSGARDGSGRDSTHCTAQVLYLLCSWAIVKGACC